VQTNGKFDHSNLSIIYFIAYVYHWIIFKRTFSSKLNHLNACLIGNNYIFPKTNLTKIGTNQYKPVLNFLSWHTPIFSFWLIELWNLSLFKKCKTPLEIIDYTSQNLLSLASVVCIESIIKASLEIDICKLVRFEKCGTITFIADLYTVTTLYRYASTVVVVVSYAVHIGK